ncbi:MAG: hypothetical protein K6B18_17280 [Ruminococcus sp.]|nr:hypothetical protein [Ruminococcus sp.]
MVTKLVTVRGVKMRGSSFLTGFVGHLPFVRSHSRMALVTAPQNRPPDGFASPVYRSHKPQPEKVEAFFFIGRVSCPVGLWGNYSEIIIILQEASKKRRMSKG